jgi:hypothetical protein
MAIPKNKYNAIKIEVDGIKFDSRAEARRYRDLTILQGAGKISDLETHKKFDLIGHVFNRDANKMEKGVSYICDFFYYDKEVEAYVIEDVKGVKTAAYKIKKKLFLLIFGDTYLFREIQSDKSFRRRN